ncbi:hypothetical protein NDU88_003052 [Pleurodeles waltl]|uniref:Uncharacterized protein n=1 Tax=Pleurodeles waltl TaxID=8319 RepID=A0AAV7UYW5_PLEWA|nr:hypothetical protein NDU88_003052 [Pleurodeles waltl]
MAGQCRGQGGTERKFRPRSGKSVVITEDQKGGGRQIKKNTTREPEYKPLARWQAERKTRTTTEAFLTTAMGRPAARTSETVPGWQDSAEETAVMSVAGSFQQAEREDPTL